MKKQLHPGAKWQWRVGLIWTIIILLLVLIFTLVPMSISANIETGNNSTQKLLIYGAIFLIIIIAVVGEIFIRMSYNRWFYEFTDTNLRQDRGVIWKTYSNVPYERIQNVDIRRGIVARIMGFSTVHIQTAGYSVTPNGKGYGAEGYIPAVEVKEAEKIRDFIMSKTARKTNGGL